MASKALHNAPQWTLAGSMQGLPRPSNTFPRYTTTYWRGTWVKAHCQAASTARQTRASTSRRSSATPQRRRLRPDQLAAARLQRRTERLQLGLHCRPQRHDLRRTQGFIG